MIKIRFSVLKMLVKESLMLEINDPEKAAQRLMDLTRVTLKNKANGEPALLGFMRNVGMSKDVISFFRNILNTGSPSEAIAAARDISCAVFGYRPSSSSSSTTQGTSDACDTDVAKKNLKRLVA